MPGWPPIEKSSGSSVRGHPQVGGGGNAQLRKLLYMAALSACRYNPMISSFYTQLLARGKVKKVAQCAAARKLLHLAFAVVKKGKAFEADYRQKKLEGIA